RPSGTPGVLRGSVSVDGGDRHRHGPGVPLPAGEKERSGSDSGMSEHRAQRFLSALVAAVLMGAAFVLPARHPLPFDAFVFHRLPGLPCLTCGLTRSVCLFARGDFTGSLTMHPAGWLAFVSLFVGCAWLMWEAAVDRDLNANLRGRLVRTAIRL